MNGTKRACLTIDVPRSARGPPARAVSELSAAVSGLCATNVSTIPSLVVWLAGEKNLGARCRRLPHHREHTPERPSLQVIRHGGNTQSDASPIMALWCVIATNCVGVRKNVLRGGCNRELERH